MSVSVGGSITNIISDIRGNRISIEDPDAGTITSTYNVLNQLTSRTDANLNQTAYTYDLIGRTTQIVYSKGTASETITYTYDNASGSGIGKLATVKKNGSNDCVYVYDDFGRPSEIRFGVAGYKQQYAYNDLGQLQYFTYPDSYCIENVYNTYGELKQIRDATTDTLIYAVDTRNKFRQPLKCRYGNETGVEYSYNAYGMLTGIKNGNVVGKTIINGGGTGSVAEEDVSYSINNQYRQLTYTYNDRGFIGSRSDAKVSQSETYTYDDLDRLTSYTVNGVTAASFTYGNTGNILTNSKVGTYSYGNSKPHAVTGIHGDYTCPISTSQCDVTYNLRNKPASIAENGYSITFDYNAAGMRRYTRYYQGNAMKKATARISDVHEMETATGLNRKLDYIYAEGQIVAVHVKNGMTDSLYYVMTDHLGSWNKVMDKDKNIVQQTHFDPWGNRMSYTAWNTPQTQTSFTFRRGFTGHEHYDRFKIINANARLYDPVIGRFFSPDPFIQAPDFTQNYNRYSYCLNNPVMFSDPNGEFFWIPAVIVGAYLGGSAVNGTLNPVNWDYSNWQTYAGMAVGGIAGYAGAAIGASVATSAIANGANAISAGMASGMIGGMASGGINGAGMTAIMGGNFSDIIGSMTMGMVIGGFSGALSGGVGSAIGDFSGVVGSSFKNGVYELGHSALKGAATGLAGGAMMAAMEKDASYLWKGAAMGAAFSIGMAGLRIGALGTAFIPDADIYCEVPDYGQVYRRGSIFMGRGYGITLGRNVAVKFTGDTDYDRYVLQHETGHLNQINDMGIAKFYGRTLKEYAHHLFGVGNFDSVYRTPGTLEYAADYYVFQRLGYYYDYYKDGYGIRYIFP